MAQREIKFTVQSRCCGKTLRMQELTKAVIERGEKRDLAGTNGDFSAAVTYWLDEAGNIYIIRSKEWITLRRFWWFVYWCVTGRVHPAQPHFRSSAVKGRRMSKVLVLASYCGAEDDNGCTDINPCPECLEMCNVFEADLSKAEFIAQFDNLKQGLGKHDRTPKRRMTREQLTLDEAKAEGQRWLDRLKREEEKSIAIQKIAASVRRGEIDPAEGKRRLRSIDNCSVTVYDGSRLAEAVKLLISR